MFAPMLHRFTTSLLFPSFSPSASPIICDTVVPRTQTTRVWDDLKRAGRVHPNDVSCTLMSGADVMPRVYPGNRMHVARAQSIATFAACAISHQPRSKKHAWHAVPRESTRIMVDPRHPSIRRRAAVCRNVLQHLRAMIFTVSVIARQGKRRQRLPGFG